jgi:hypothetical protein
MPPFILYQHATCKNSGPRYATRDGMRLHPTLKDHLVTQADTPVWKETTVIRFPLGGNTHHPTEQPSVDTLWADLETIQHESVTTPRCCAVELHLIARYRGRDQIRQNSCAVYRGGGVQIGDLLTVAKILITQAKGDALGRELDMCSSSLTNVLEW